MSSRIARKPAAQPPSIETLRARMDEINLKILRLVSLRAKLAMEIGRLKHHHGEVYKPVRERAIIEKMIAENQGPLSDEQVKRIYVEIISACRALEHEPRVAFLGPEHTRSHEAARMRFGSRVKLMPLESFAVAVLRGGGVGGRGVVVRFRPGAGGDFARRIGDADARSADRHGAGDHRRN